MKKITFLFMILIISFGFSQGDPLPYDFDNTLHGMIQDGGAIISNGTGNDVLQIVGATSDWDNAQVTFNTPIDLSDTANNTLRFTIQSTTAMPGEVRQHGVSFQDGGGAVELNFTTTGQNVENVELNFGDPGAGTPTRNRMIIFTDCPTFGVGSGGTGGLSGTYIIDDITIGPDPLPTCDDGIQNGDEEGVDCGGTGGCPDCPSPATAAPTPPAREMNDVIALASLAYTESAPIAVNSFAGATLENFTVDTTDDTRLLTAAPGGGVQYEYNPGLDLTDFTYIHIDVWVSDFGSPGSVLTLQIQNFDGGGGFQHNISTNVDVHNGGSGETWIGGDFELSTFTNGGLSRDNIRNVQLIAQGPAYGPVYYANLYFHKNTTLGVEDNEIFNFRVFPNPTQDSWTVKTQNASIESVRVFDIMGKSVLTLSPNSNETTIDGTSLVSGIYFAQIKTASGTNSIKLIKQ